MFDKFRSDDAETNKAVLVFRVLRQCGRLLVLNRCGTQAAALAYHTMFGIVPLAIVILMVFQMFPASKNMGDKVRQLIYEQSNLTKISYPSDTPGGKEISLAAKIDEITGSYISNLNTGAITFIGGLLTIWAAISLLTTIEKAFNSIWGVPKSRDILHRTINYWALLTLGPLLIGVGVYLSAKSMQYAFPHTHQESDVRSPISSSGPNGLQYAFPPSHQESDVRSPISSSDPNGSQYAFSQTLLQSVFKYIKPVFSFALSMILMFFLYMFIPNAKVKPRSALLGAVFAAIFWTAAKYGFGIYVTKASYQSVYGIMGLIPLAVLWIYIIWWVVLMGLQLTYATQHVHSLEKAEKMARLRAKQTNFIATEQTTIQIMREVLQAFNDKGRKPIMPSEIADATALPADFIEHILENLTRADLLCKTTEPIVGFVPSTDGANITLADISIAVEKSSFQTQNPKLRQVMEQVRAELAKFNLKDIL
ncbi:MAG: YihY family inner membrane protein [Planctomycetes bacterium]|nr:YihY family inner membrane protein [Planctomycetota bacterium]